MHSVVIDEPYEFVPPYRGRFWAWAFGRFVLPQFLKRTYGIASFDVQGLDILRESIKARHGVILCPNHCRPSDPMLMGLLVRHSACYVYAMASWHIFKESPLQGIIARRMGGFSVYREGIDRQSLDTAIDIVSHAERPLIIFPEGVISRANDRLLTLMDGVSFIARMAAKKRTKQNANQRVVIHPVAVRYKLLGDLETSVSGPLAALEQRTFWKTHEHLPIRQRISQLGQALLAAREIECLGQPQAGSLSCRMARLIDAVLHPQELEWLGIRRSGDVASRVKDLRTAMLPEILQGHLTSEEKKRRWRQLTDSYYLQCLSMYPPEYLDDGVRGVATPERYAETVHRLEEDLTDLVTIRPEWHATIQIGEPIEVDGAARRSRGEADPLMENLRQRMLGLLGVQDWWPPTPVETCADSVDACDSSHQ
jgi:hypothetical protein